MEVAKSRSWINKRVASRSQTTAFYLWLKYWVVVLPAVDAKLHEAHSINEAHSAHSLVS